MIFWKFLSTWSHAANLDNLVASIPFPASPVEAIAVEILLSTQGSRKVNVENHPSCIRSWSMLITFKSSESSKEVHQDRSWLFSYASLVSIANVKRCTLSFSRVSPHHDQFLRPLDLICVSVTTVWRHDVTPPSFPQPYSRPRDPTSWPLSSPVLSTQDYRVVYTTYLTGQLTVTAPQRL
jgi:hypothetical protein